MKKEKNTLQKTICPETGYELTFRPEWTDVIFDKGYHCSLSILYDRILFCRPDGYATLTGVKVFLKLVDDITITYFPKDKPFVIIEDFSNFTGSETKGRREYIKGLQQNSRLRGLLFFGTSPLLKISVKLAKRFYRGPVMIDITNDYQSAVSLAQQILVKADKDVGSLSELKETSSANTQISGGQVKIENRMGRKEWSAHMEGFSIVFKALDEKILYSTVNGSLRLEYVDEITKLRTEALRSMNPKGVFDYIISDVTKLERAEGRARVSYIQSFREWSRKYPFKMSIFVGTNRFMQTAISLARPLMPFTIRTASSIEGALALIRQDHEQDALSSSSDTANLVPPNRLSDQMKPYVSELLGYLGVIDWEPGSSVQPHEVKPDHPFFPIYEAVKVIKDELDELFDEKNRYEISLRQANEELESRVQSRTADLERANLALKVEIKERKETMIALRQAKRFAEKANRSKSEFLANMSHELRTPLNHIIGFTEMLLDQHFGPLNAKQTGHLQDVANSSEHLLALINDILDLSKIEAGKMELSCASFQLDSFLQNTLKIIQKKASDHDITIHLDVSKAPETIHADRRKLRQVMNNLLSNAVKFTPDGGTIQVAAYSRSNEPNDYENNFSAINEKSLSCQSAEDDRMNPLWVEIAVKDTGIGIGHEDINRIFNVFEQVDGSSSRYYQGTGLGLSLARRLINLHGGHIWAESAGKGCGSVFRCLIPINPEKVSFDKPAPLQ